MLLLFQGDLRYVGGMDVSAAVLAGIGIRACLLVDGVTPADVDFLRLRRSRVHEVVEGARTSTRS